MLRRIASTLGFSHNRYQKVCPLGVTFSMEKLQQYGIKVKNIPIEQTEDFLDAFVVLEKPSATSKLKKT